MSKSDKTQKGVPPSGRDKSMPGEELLAPRRREEERGYKPEPRPIDWSHVQRPPGSAVKPPKK
ncbi:MAG: hypothetical protein M3Q65_05410 [Chloroflexota bacterium]|nr:hypothetical protein [Chloroflexota bacterium]